MESWTVLYVLTAQLLVLESSVGVGMMNDNTDTIQRDTPSAGIGEPIIDATHVQRRETSPGVDAPLGVDTRELSTPSDLDSNLNDANIQQDDGKDTDDVDDVMNDTDAKWELPGQKKTGIRRELPGQNNIVIRRELPGQNKTGIGRELPGQNNTDIRRELPGQNNTEIRRELPGQNDTNIRRELPGQNNTDIRRELPGQNNTDIRRELPGQNNTDIRRELPGQNSTDIRRELPGQNNTGIRRELPGQNKTGIRRELPGQNKTGIRRELPGQNNIVIRRELPGQNNTDIRRELPGQNNTDIRRELPGQNITDIRRELPGQNDTNIRRELPGQNNTDIRRELPGQNNTDIRRELPGQNNTDIRRELPGQNNTDIRRELPGLLAMYCPGSDVCREDNSEDFSENVQSACCRACSCSENCQVSRNCCFLSPNNDNNESKHSSCYSTLYPAEDDNERLGFKSYMMIDSEMLPNNISTNDTCGNANVAPWGSLYPVYSKSSRKIYKNSVCAAAYGVKDGVLWKASVVCRNQLLIIQSNSTTSTAFGEQCDVWFEFPGDATDLEEHLCFLSLVSSCPDSFSISTSKQSCESGLMSPYRGRDRSIYRNVFCSVCHSMYRSIGCVSDDIRFRNTRVFTALIDESRLNEPNKSSLRKPVQQACFIQEGTLIKSTCRPVMCPAGQTYTADGVCKFIFKTWYKPAIKVSLQLVSDVALNTTDITVHSFVSQWLPHWKLSKIYYFSSQTTQPMLTKKILVTLIKRFESISPKLLTRNINIMKNEEWTMKVANVSWSLSADFMEEHDNKNLYDFYNRATRLEINDTRSLEVIHSNNLDSNAGYIAIDHMMYCEQVDLTKEEFRVDNRVLYSNFTAEYLLPGQYYFPDTPDETFVRVCLEQSGLTRVHNGGNCPVLTTCIVFVYLSLLIAYYI